MTEGGSLSKNEIIKAALQGRQPLADFAYRAGYNTVSKLIGEGASFALLEAALDAVYINKVREAKRVSFGPAIVSAFLAAKEFDAKNIRLIISMKHAGASLEAIREKVRLSCV